MLTFEINDAQLEHRILEKARSIGKSVQDLLKDIVAEKLQTEELTSATLPFEVPKLDYRQYIKIIDEPLGDDIIDDSPIFQNDIDTIKFAKQLREQAWKRKS
jgi:hypothetical protein